MPTPIASLRLSGLFDRLDHNVSFRSRERITILTGPNGSGKTHVLRILHLLTSLNFEALRAIAVDSVTLTLTNGKSLHVTRDSSDGKVSTLHVVGRGPNNGLIGEFTVGGTTLSPEDVPPWIHQLDDGRWFDSEADRVVSTEYILRHFTRRRHRAPITHTHPWLKEFGGTPPATFIETQRLDRPEPEVDPRTRGTATRETAKRILQYVQQIKTQIGYAKHESLAVSQQRDRRFAASALDKARITVKEGELRALYAQIAQLHQELHTNGLTEEAIGLEFPPGRTNPTERRILNVFLQDWEKKLEPLLPVHRKIQILRQIVGNKMSDKVMSIGGEGDLAFHTHDGVPISVEMLSSGEQHILALVTMLLFNADSNSLVLIDEPELSLHAAWKHEFLNDIAKVAALNRLTVVLATHSTAIINGRWELVEELGL